MLIWLIVEHLENVLIVKNSTKRFWIIRLFVFQNESFFSVPDILPCPLSTNNSKPRDINIDLRSHKHRGDSIYTGTSIMLRTQHMSQTPLDVVYTRSGSLLYIAEDQGHIRYHRTYYNRARMNVLTFSNSFLSLSYIRLGQRTVY